MCLDGENNRWPDIKEKMMAIHHPLICRFQTRWQHPPRDLANLFFFFIVRFYSRVEQLIMEARFRHCDKKIKIL